MSQDPESRALAQQVVPRPSPGPDETEGVKIEFTGWEGDEDWGDDEKGERGGVEESCVAGDVVGRLGGGGIGLARWCCGCGHGRVGCGERMESRAQGRVAEDWVL